MQRAKPVFDYPELEVDKSWSKTIRFSGVVYTEKTTF